MVRTMSSPGPTRRQNDLADMIEMLLDKGVVINADIAVSIGDTELLGVEIRAAIASFETAAKYGLEFPEGTDMERVERATGSRQSLDDGDGEADVETDDEDGAETGDLDHPGRRPHAVAEAGEDSDED